MLKKKWGSLNTMGHQSSDSLESRTGPVWREEVLLEGNFLNAISDTPF